MLNTVQLVILGRHMRESANDREGLPVDSSPTVPVLESWGFVGDNAGEDSEELFGVDVPEYLPEFPPHAFIAAYYSSSEFSVESIASLVTRYFDGNPMQSEMSA